MTVQEHAGNEKSCVWHAADFSDGELKDELFCIRFGSIDSKFTSVRLYFLVLEPNPYCLAISDYSLVKFEFKFQSMIWIQIRD